MSFNLYNILSHLIPGFLVYLVGLKYLGINPKDYDTISATSIAYILGYFINTLGAWIEGVMNYTWGGQPSNQLLEGKKCGRISFPEYVKIKQLISQKLSNRTANNSDIFKVAMRLSGNEGRINEMNGHYAFSRSLFIGILLSLIILGILYYQNIFFWVISIVLIVSSWHRTKERGFCYAKEVLNVALNNIEKE